MRYPEWSCGGPKNATVAGIQSSPLSSLWASFVGSELSFWTPWGFQKPSQEVPDEPRDPSPEIPKALLGGLR